MTTNARHTLRLLILAASALALVSAVACAPSSTNESVTLRVFAASSLTNALTDVAKAFEAENNNVTVETHFAASSRLRAQIQEGAQADVFISADPRHIDEIPHLLVESSVTTVASNTMVVALADSESPIQSLAELADPGLRIVIALPDVPAGRYARALIANLGQRPDFPENYAEAVLANIVSEETNVRAVLAKVLLGEADAGFTYRTDTRNTGLHSLTIPTQTPNDIAYQAATLQNSPHQTAAHDLLQFLTSETGRQILSNHGFIPVAP